MENCCLDTKCFRCCIDTNMILSSDDIETIQNLGYENIFFIADQAGWLQLKNFNGRCVFHDGTKCTIYAHRPRGCRLYPVVYDKDNDCAILDNECTQKHSFTITNLKKRQLRKLIILLEKERSRRLKIQNQQKEKK